MKNAEAILQPTFFSQPRNVILAILGVVAIWIAFPGNVQTLALIGVVIIFLFGIKRPLWAVAAILVSTLTIAGFMVGTPWVDISLRLLLLLVTGFLIWRSYFHVKFELGTNAKQIIIPLLILIVSRSVNFSI